MKKITYPAALIRAAQVAQGVNDVRYYLCGIHVEPQGEKEKKPRPSRAKPPGPLDGLGLGMREQWKKGVRG